MSLSVDFGQANVRLLTCGAVLAGGTVLSGVTAGIAGVFAGMAASVLATDLHNFLVKRMCCGGKVLHNPDLTKLVGGTIAFVIQSVAEAKQFPNYKPTLQKLAKTAVEYWPTVARATDGEDDPFANLKEDRLAAIYFATTAKEFAEVTALEPETWTDILDWLIKKADEPLLPPDIISYLAKILHIDFPKVLRQILIEDAEKGGKAFADLAISLMGEIASATQLLQSNLKAQHADIITRLENLAVLTPNNPESIQKFCSLLSNVESGLSASLATIGLQNRRIEALLLKMAVQFNDMQVQMNELKPQIKVKSCQAQEPDKKRIAFIISGTLDEEQAVSLKAILAHLQKISRDTDLTTIDIQEGSIIFILEGSPEGIDRLNDLFQSGKLTEVLGISVESVKPINDRLTITVDEQEEFANSLLQRCRREGYDWVEVSDILKILDAIRLAYLSGKEAIQTALEELLIPDFLVGAVQKSSSENDDCDGHSEKEEVDTEFLDALTDEILKFYKM